MDIWQHLEWKPLDDHREPGGLDALRLPAGKVDLHSTGPTSRMMVVPPEFREIARGEVIAHLVHRYALRPRASAARGIPPARMWRVHELVAANLASVSFDATAAEAGMILCRFAREYKQATENTSWTQILRERVSIALRMICEGHSPARAARRAEGA